MKYTKCNERKNPNSFYVEKPFESLKVTVSTWCVMRLWLWLIGVSICDKRDRCVFDIGYT